MKLTIALFFLLLPFFTFCQENSIHGKITDALNNKPLAGVSVSVSDMQMGVVTDSLGVYQLSGLKAGFYTIQFSLIGYRQKVLYDVQVTVAKEAVADIGLEQDVRDLKEVKVYSPRYDKTSESPVSLKTIGSAEIKRNPGGNRDISKVIQSLPGVGAPVGFRNDIIIRGGAPNENRFYLDGMEIPTINHFTTQGASGGPVGLINVDFIKSVDFYSGAFPADRGNALSSVFEFKQKDGPADKRHATLSVGSSDFDATLEGPLGRKTSFISSYRYSYLQGLFKLLGLPFLPSYQDFQFKVKKKFDRKNELTILGIGAIDRFRLNMSATSTEQDRYDLATIPVNAQENYTVGLTYRNYRSKGSSLFVLSRNYLHNATYKYTDNDPGLAKTTDYQSTEIENKLRFENVSSENGYKVTVGAGAETGSYSTATHNLLPYGDLIYNSSIYFLKYSLFGQLSHPFFQDKLTLSFGVRADANNFSGNMDNPLKTISPRFSASYAITEKFSFNFNTGIYYQLPAYTLLGYRDSTGALVNKNVSYISNQQLVAGLEYVASPKTRFTVEGFYKYYSHYPRQKILGDTVSLANLGADFGVVGNAPVVGNSNGHSYGLELFGQQRLNKGFYGLFALTLFRSEFQDKHGSYIPSSWNTRFILSMTGGKLFKRNWELGAKWRYTGGSPYTPYNVSASSLKSNYKIYPEGIQDYNQLNSHYLPNFYQLDIRLDKKYPFKKFTLNVYIDIQNLTNNQYSSQPYLLADRDPNGGLQDAPGDPSRIKTKLLDNTGGNVTPTIGIIVEL